MSMKNCRKIESNKEGTSNDEVMKNSNELVELTKTGLMRAFVESQEPSSSKHLSTSNGLVHVIIRESKEEREKMDSVKIPDKIKKDEAEQAVGRIHTTDTSNETKSSAQKMEETRRICQMRAFVEALTNNETTCISLCLSVVDDLMLRRFLRARDLDVKQASTMFLKYLKWRQTIAPNASISASEVPIQISQNKLFSQGSAKRGCPIALLLAARHYQVKGGLEEFKRYVVYGFDKLCARMPPGQEKFIVIGDLEGWGYSNSDIRAYLGALSIVQDYYPERLEKMFIVHVPSMFMTVWKIVCPFIDKKTKEKIVFVDNKTLKSTLLEEIDESQLPDIYGGKLPLVPI